MQTAEYIIELNEIHLYAYHGVIEQERSIGAWYTINASFTISDFSCLENDSIEGTVSYADIYDTICEEMKKPSQLLENVCYRISDKVYSRFTQVSAISITLSKDTPPMGGDRLNAAVTIRSTREQPR